MELHTDHVNQCNTYILGTKLGYRGFDLEQQLQEKNQSYVNVWGWDYRSSDKSSILEHSNNFKANFLLDRDLTLGEICCALGHREIYNEFLETSFEWALVLEDDARLVLKEIPYTFLEKIARHKPSIIQLYGLAEALVQLPINQKEIQMIKKGGVGDLYRLNFIPELTHAYFINRLAAKQLSESTMNGIYSTADWPLLGTKGLHFYTSGRPVFVQNPDISILEADRFGSMLHNKQNSKKLRSFLNILGLKALFGVRQRINPVDMQNLILRRIYVRLVARYMPHLLFRRVK
jgi:GR25 family glycosyltransferase involved in LPS biosynthesis